MLLRPLLPMLGYIYYSCVGLGYFTELQKFVGIAKSPTLDPYIQKLIESRKKLIMINTTLKTVQDRLDRIYGQASKKRASLAEPQAVSS